MSLLYTVKNSDTSASRLRPKQRLKAKVRARNSGLKANNVKTSRHRRLVLASTDFILSFLIWMFK